MPRLLSLSLILVLHGFVHADFITTFEGLGLPPESFINNAGPAGGFTVDGHFLNNSFDATFGSWSGWSLSTMTDSTTPGFGNQYSAIPGSGAGGSATYAVAFTSGFPIPDPFHPASSFINLANGSSPNSIQVTNTTYAYYSMRDGDQFARQFGPGDFFLLDVRGYDDVDGGGTLVGTVEFYLANFLNGNSTIVNSWETIDLLGLTGSKSLVFGLRSSDNDPFLGMNTPAFFALDNLSYNASSIPEPSSVALILLTSVGVIGMKARKFIQRRVMTGEADKV